MIRVLIGFIFAAIGYSVGYAGRFRLPIRRGSNLHLVLGKMNLAQHVAVVIAASALPPLTHFAGLSLLAYLGATLILVSLFVYPRGKANLLEGPFKTRGKRALPAPKQGKSRRPYVVLCSAGYLLALAYVMTIASIYLH